MKQVLDIIKQMGDTICGNFGFEGMYDFFNSMIHSKLLLFTMPTAILLFVSINKWLGITSAMFLALGVAATVELITGLWSSRVRKVKFSSRKFSRFGLKILVWGALIFLFQAFKISYEGLEGWQNYITYNLFSWLHGTVVIYVVLEYSISILENWARISGKPQHKLLAFLQKKMDQWFELAENQTDHSETPPQRNEQGPAVETLAEPNKLPEIEN